VRRTELKHLLHKLTLPEEVCSFIHFVFPTLTSYIQDEEDPQSPLDVDDELEDGLVRRFEFKALLPKPTSSTAA
jgi:hypothetical protein